MASIVASRQRLQQLHDNVSKAKKAFRQAEDTYNALYTRQDQRRRREWGLDSDDEDDEDGSEIDSDSELGREIEENKTDSEREGEDQAKEAKSDEFADEEEEGFDFEAKSSRLEAVRDQSKADVTKALSAFVDDFERCAKADVLGPLTELYTTMCTKLSIEMRNIIYTYLVKRIDYPYQVHHDTYSYWNPNFQSYESTAIDHWLKRAERAFEYGTWDILKPGGWLLNPEFVGHGLARELAEVFYTVNEFAANDARFLPDLLTADRTLTGFKPYEYIRGQFNAYISTTCGNGSNERAWQTTENEVEFLDGVYKNLNLIQLITHKSQLSVTIGVSSSSPLREDAIEGDRRFHNIMESIRSPVYDLMYSGVKVLVKHTAHSSYRTRTISEGGELNYFAMSKEEWEKEKSSHGPDWLPSQDFISKEELQDDRNKVRVRELLKQKWGHVKSIDAYGI